MCVCVCVCVYTYIYLKTLPDALDQDELRAGGQLQVGRATAGHIQSPNWRRVSLSTPLTRGASTAPFLMLWVPNIAAWCGERSQHSMIALWRRVLSDSRLYDTDSRFTNKSFFYNYISSNDANICIYYAMFN